MTTSEGVALIIALLTLATALANHLQVREVKQHVDGKMEQLLELTATSSKAEGVLQEKQNPSTR